MSGQRKRDETILKDFDKDANPYEMPLTDLPKGVNPFGIMRGELNDMSSHYITAFGRETEYDTIAHLIRSVLLRAEQCYDKGYTRMALRMVWQAGLVSTVLIATIPEGLIQEAVRDAAKYLRKMPRRNVRSSKKAIARMTFNRLYNSRTDFRNQDNDEQTRRIRAEWPEGKQLPAASSLVRYISEFRRNAKS